MVAIEAGGANGTTGGAQAVGVAMGKPLGANRGVDLAWVFLTAAVVYNYAFARLLFVSGLEKRLPHRLGAVNRNKVPANAVMLQDPDRHGDHGHRVLRAGVGRRMIRSGTSTRCMPD
jgi:amino acid transporter